MKRVLPTIIVVLFVSLAGLVRAQDKTPARAFMRAKLDHAQKILEGLTTEDFDSITKHARTLTLLSQETDWNVLQTAEYRRLSEDFRRYTTALSRSAEAKNLEGATLAYFNVTMNCIECHKHVRDVQGNAAPLGRDDSRR